ncbi:MAG TPA: hypothetical protein VGL08_01160, partial [Paraburkholderia sp.]
MAVSMPATAQEQPSRGAAGAAVLPADALPAAPGTMHATGTADTSDATDTPAPRHAAGTEADDTSTDSQDSQQGPAANSFNTRQKALDARTQQNDYRFGVARHNCYSTFFVNHCVNKAHDAMRAEQADIRRQQLALDDEERVDHARQRDEQAALKQAQYEAEAPQRAAVDQRNAQAYEDKQRQHAVDQ